MHVQQVSSAALTFGPSSAELLGPLDNTSGAKYFGCLEQTTHQHTQAGTSLTFKNTNLGDATWLRWWTFCANHQLMVREKVVSSTTKEEI